MDNKLKPCPFCGGKASIVRWRRDGRRTMKGLVVAALLLISVSAAAKWTDVPTNLSTTLFLKNYMGSIEGSVDICPWTWEAVEPLFSNATATAPQIAETFHLVEVLVEGKFGAGARFLYMHVSPWSAGDVYWYPWNIVFVQGSHQGSVTVDDILGGFLGEFSGRLYVDGDGFVRLPEWIDYSKPFDIWYDKAKTTLGPVTG